MGNDAIRSQEWIDKIEALVHRAEAISDAGARSIAVDLLQAVLSFHAAGIERILEIISESVAGGDAAVDAIAKDDLTSSMLLLHDLHPDELETRIDRAIRRLQDMFASLGANLMLEAIEGETVRLRFDSSRSWSAAAVKGSIENVIFQAAPEIATVVIDGLKEAPSANFVPVSDLLAGSRV
jgi:hypothetical protein